MEKHGHGFLIFLFVIQLSLGLLSFACCMIAEFKKVKRGDVKLDNKFCYLPESRAFGYGIAALICLIAAQIIGNLGICCKKNSFTSEFATPFLVLSWMSFGVAVILLSTATSMGRRQEYGKGWLKQECYVVKDGVYFGSAFLVLLSVASAIASAFSNIRKTQATRVHAHAQSQAQEVA
ncbi:protein MODIFYING WALL LIGNIN-1-like [Mercurialis annua]|uniref:protein MODIFYING WALL LIGNIN-1-like n=1 Tax=Mercurialis annua TaxID=3986 RepID=UPI00215DF388|nr:protein MODIFYING WALL LIGNIN-1-like [Mercurialis annua]